jgi:hypothetical protein
METNSSDESISISQQSICSTDEFAFFDLSVGFSGEESLLRVTLLEENKCLRVTSRAHNVIGCCERRPGLSVMTIFGELIFKRNHATEIVFLLAFERRNYALGKAILVFSLP